MHTLHISSGYDAILEIENSPKMLAKCYSRYNNVNIKSKIFFHLIDDHIVCRLFETLEAEAIVSPVLAEVAVHRIKLK